MAESQTSSERTSALADAEAIRRCLIYLEAEAGKLGLGMTAHLIGVAAETVAEVIAAERKVISSPTSSERPAPEASEQRNGRAFARYRLRARQGGAGNGH